MKHYVIPKGTSVYPLNEHFSPIVMLKTKETWYFDETDIVKLAYDTEPYIVVKLNQPVLLEEHKVFAYAFTVDRYSDVSWMWGNKLAAERGNEIPQETHAG